jgi:hypothetical protein
LGSLTLLANLPQVSTTPAVPVAKFAACVTDTDGNFATGVVDTGRLRTSPHILKKFERTLMLFSGPWGRLINEENLKQKIL